MSISVKCGCGKNLVFADEHEGKRVLCPACKAPVVVRHPDAILDLGDVPPVAKNEVARHWSGHPVILSGAFALGLAGVILLVAKVKTSNPPAMPVLDIADQVAATQPSFAYVANPSEKDILQWKSYARYRAENLAETAFREDPAVEHFEVAVADVNPSPPDPRKLSWLWTSSTTVNVDYRKGTAGAHHRTWRLTGLFRLVPPDNLQLIWLELNDEKNNDRSRRHMETSEWRPDFRKAVKSAWEKADGRKSVVAKWMNLEQVEVQDIVDFDQK